LDSVVDAIRFQIENSPVPVIKQLREQIKHCNGVLKRGDILPPIANWKSRPASIAAEIHRAYQPCGNQLTFSGSHETAVAISAAAPDQSPKMPGAIQDIVQRIRRIRCQPLYQVSQPEHAGNDEAPFIAIDPNKRALRRANGSGRNVSVIGLDRRI
jgi:hypothetical protein